MNSDQTVTVQDLIKKLQDSIKELVPFKDKLESQDLVDDLATIARVSIDADNAGPIRAKLTNIFTHSQSESIAINNISLATVTYNTLVVLADLYPLNKKDSDSENTCPITLCSIEKKDLFVSASGYYFDINGLVSWFKTNNSFQHPVTRLQFCQRELDRMKMLSADPILNMSPEDAVDNLNWRNPAPLGPDVIRGLLDHVGAQARNAFLTSTNAAPLIMAAVASSNPQLLLAILGQMSSEDIRQTLNTSVTSQPSLVAYAIEHGSPTMVDAILRRQTNRQ